MNARDVTDEGRGGRIEPAQPSADAAMKNESPGDGIMQNDLTEEREGTPAQRERASHDQPQDP